MGGHPLTDELREAERRLPAAQLPGDSAALEQLLDIGGHVRWCASRGAAAVHPHLDPRQRSWLARCRHQARMTATTSREAGITSHRQEG